MNRRGFFAWCASAVCALLGLRINDALHVKNLPNFDYPPGYWEGMWSVMQKRTELDTLNGLYKRVYMEKLGQSLPSFAVLSGKIAEGEDRKGLCPMRDTTQQ